MDLKATALLKLIYLEMFGHDMSWASFHVLEVMSCPKYLQKRVGYLAAVQSFRPDTEVLMLATNLLKKDISSPLAPTMSLPLITLPHIITSSLALSLLSDLLPRLSHSNPNVRKKAVAALYRLALVYPDTLRSAWPKIKDILMNEEEDSSVTAAVVNVVCELGWRRPRDFLALAPRLFDLLVGGGNNWMAIKIIKLFATLTPLEPRLIKKLLPPLTNLIRTTPAMSLLYECINGVIQGGILEGTDGETEGEEIAALCVGKLRSMIVVEGDPNLKYVALLAFNRIVASHPHLVSMQQDVIMNCIGDPDISIRLQALELGTGMVNSDNLVTVVERLMQQLRNTPVSTNTADDERFYTLGVEPAADSDREDPEETLRPTKEPYDDAPALPAEYKNAIIRQILGMCSKDTYANILDFEWYIDILLQLVKLVPSVDHPCSEDTSDTNCEFNEPQGDVSIAIGWELRNVAVRVRMVRSEAVQAANSLLNSLGHTTTTSPVHCGRKGVLQYAAWIVGEYVENCVNLYYTMDNLLSSSMRSSISSAIRASLQAIPKVLASIVTQRSSPWDAESKTMISLLVARVIHFLEPLTTHPNLEVQERSVEFLELMRVAVQAITSHDPESDHGPLLLTRALPDLFMGSELNPVAPSAQRKVPVPAELDLETPINQDLARLLQSADQDDIIDSQAVDFETFYNQRQAHKAITGPAIDTLTVLEATPSSYQQAEETLIDPDAVSRNRIQRRERNKDDPFYIGADDASSGLSTPFHEILRSTNGDDVDVDAIPIMSLELGDKGLVGSQTDAAAIKQKRKRPKKVHIAKDENIVQDSSLSEPNQVVATGLGGRFIQRTRDKGKKSVLEVDSSGLGSLSLDSAEMTAGQSQNDVQRQEAQDSEMAKALVQVERVRLEMQRASERIQAEDGAPAEGTLVKKKKRKMVKQPGTKRQTASAGKAEEHSGNNEPQVLQGSVVPLVKKKSKKRKTLVADDNPEGI